MPADDADLGVLGTYRRFLPPPHRLFAVFGDVAAAAAAVRIAEEMGALAGGEVWFFDGPDGARHLDPYELARRGTVGSFRFFVWVFSNNVEYLSSLAKAVRQGRTVVAVSVRGQRAADRAARWLWFGGGTSFAYTTHGNFVPVLL
jgi:NADPH-dependent ferric siderophore reductase